MLCRILSSHLKKKKKKKTFGILGQWTGPNEIWKTLVRCRVCLAGHELVCYAHREDTIVICISYSFITQGNERKEGSSRDGEHEKFVAEARTLVVPSL